MLEKTIRKDHAKKTMIATMMIGEVDQVERPPLE